MKKSDPTLYDVCVQCAHAKVLHQDACRHSNAWSRCYCSKYVAPIPPRDPAGVMKQDLERPGGKLCRCAHGYSEHLGIDDRCLSRDPLNGWCTCPSFRAWIDGVTTVVPTEVRYQEIKSRTNMLADLWNEEWGPVPQVDRWDCVERIMAAQGTTSEKYRGFDSKGSKYLVTIVDGRPTNLDVDYRAPLPYAGFEGPVS